MRAAVATQAGSQDAANEDWAGVAAPGLAVVLDGLSAPDGTGTGCRHGTPWFVSQLGPRLLALAADPSRSLADALAEAIRQVASLHPGCDLSHPGTPSATMVLLRVRDEGADYLALADATLLLDTADGLKVISDERVDQLASKEREAANQVPTGSALKLRRRAQLTRALRRARNRPGGYWVAAADPQAASQAITGTLPDKTLRRAALLSDGASRLVDLFELATWEELLALVDENGPDELLRQVRAAEAVDAEGRQWPRTKRSDDATAVYLVLSDDRAWDDCQPEAP
jgi:serine/threonine protein phosphatase PrpC